MGSIFCTLLRVSMNNLLTYWYLRHLDYCWNNEQLSRSCKNCDIQGKCQTSFLHWYQDLSVNMKYIYPEIYLYLFKTLYIINTKQSRFRVISFTKEAIIQWLVANRNSICTNHPVRLWHKQAGGHLIEYRAQFTFPFSEKSPEQIPLITSWCSTSIQMNLPLK